MLELKIIFENGDYLYTKFNATLEEAKEYYIGNYLSKGKCIDIIELGSD